MLRARLTLIWALVAFAIAVPLMLAAFSPLLAWRSPVYILAGFAGVVGMALLLLQPLLAGGALPGLRHPMARRVHRAVGVLLVLALLLHIAGLWITSPPDMIDALTFTAPTAFSAFGVIAAWAILATALLAALRRRAGIRWRSWRTGHLALAGIIVPGSVAHAMLIEGTMEFWSKAALCAAALIATFWVVIKGRG